MTTGKALACNSITLLGGMMTASIVAIISATANADTITVDGVTWTYSGRNDTARTVTLGGDGTGTSDPKRAIGKDVAIDASNIPWTFDIEVDGTTKTYEVTKIGNYAFYECSRLTGTMTIPNRVTAIGKSALNRTGLTRLASFGGVTSIGSYAFDSSSGLTNAFPDLSHVTTYAIGTFQNAYFSGVARIANSVTVNNEQLFTGCRKLAGIFVPGPATVSSGSQNYTSINTKLFARNATSLMAVFVGPNTKGTNLTAGNMLQNVTNCTVFVPANTYWTGLATGGTDNKVIYYGESTNLDIVVDEDAATITATPTDEESLTNMLAAASTFKNVFGWNTVINVTNAIEVSAGAVTPAMLSDVRLNTMLMMFKVKTQVQLESVLAAVPQTTMLAIDPTDASEELTMPADRALWVWLAGTGKYRPRLNGITIVFR